jgi:hypothetical protein
LYVSFQAVKLLAGFEVLTAASMKMAVFWIIAPCNLVEVYHPDKGGSNYLRNVGKRLPDHSVPQPKRQPSSVKLLISNFFVIFLSFGNVTPNYNVSLMGNRDSLYELSPRTKLFVRAGTACSAKGVMPHLSVLRTGIKCRIIIIIIIAIILIIIIQCLFLAAH